MITYINPDAIEDQSIDWSKLKNVPEFPSGGSGTSASPMIEVTYSELKDLRDTEELVPGQQYRITDYVTSTTQENTISANHQFDIIVTADSENTINEKARACLYDGDTYFANSDLNAWQIWYCLDNDTDKFAWADENGKGVIYRMIDERGNDCPYDFKNIMFKHPKDTTTYPDYYYTFTTLVSDIVSDHSLNNSYCYSNVIKEHITLISSGTRFIRGISLNNIVFINTHLSSACYDNSFGDDCIYNSFGTDCTNNSFENYCGYNSFGNSCSSNSIGNNFSSNSFGNSCSKNSFGNNCNNNSFENYCQNNSFGNDCDHNSFGESSAYNSFRNDCYRNSFGTDCNYNSFGNSCYNNTFGNDCDHNSFGNICSDNTFGTDCSSNSFGDSYNYNSFGNSCSSNSFGNSCYNNTFGNNCNYNSFGDDCRNNSFRTTADEDGDLLDYCQYNTFDDGCKQIVLWFKNQTSSAGRLENIKVDKSASSTDTNYVYYSFNILNSTKPIFVSKEYNTTTEFANIPIGLYDNTTAINNKVYTSNVTVTPSRSCINAAGGFYETSDERLKNFSDDVTIDLEKLSSLRKKYFTWKDGHGDQQLGVSAQEVQVLYPELVNEGDDGNLSVDYAKLSVIALSAVDKLYNKQKDLEDKLAKIEKALNL